MFDRLTLPNGLRLIGEKNPNIRSCSVGVWVQAGSVHETETENGLTHFIEHMVFKGTQTRSARQIAEEMDNAGGVLNAFTAKECTCFYAKVTDDELRLAVDILLDLVLHPVFDETELNKERGVVLEEIAMEEDTPDDLVQDVLCSALYTGSLSRPILGTGEKIRNYTRDDIVCYWKKHYYPANMAVSIAGNYDWDTFVSLVSEYFSGTDSEALQPFDSEVQHMLSGRAFREKDTEQLHICLGFPGVARNTDDIYPLAVLNNALGGGMSSRLFQRIREEMGMAYSVFSFTSSYRDLGCLGIYVGTTPENGCQVIDELYHELELFRRDGITDKEFHRALIQLRSGYIMSLESSGGRMQSVGQRLILHDQILTPEEIISRIDQVTPENVMDLTKRLLEGYPGAAVVGPDAESYIRYLGEKSVG